MLYAFATLVTASKNSLRRRHRASSCAYSLSPRSISVTLRYFASAPFHQTRRRSNPEELWFASKTLRPELWKGTALLRSLRSAGAREAARSAPRSSRSGANGPAGTLLARCAALVEPPETTASRVGAVGWNARAARVAADATGWTAG